MKIGDLTIEKMVKQHDMNKCNECSFHLTSLCRIACLIKAELTEDAKYLDREIEVEEDE